MSSFFSKANRLCSVFEVEEDANCSQLFAIHFVVRCFDFGESGGVHGEKQGVVLGRLGPFIGIFECECVAPDRLGDREVVRHALLELLVLVGQLIGLGFEIGFSLSMSRALLSKLLLSFGLKFVGLIGKLLLVFIFEISFSLSGCLALLRKLRLSFGLKLGSLIGKLLLGLGFEIGLLLSGCLALSCELSL